MSTSLDKTIFSVTELTARIKQVLEHGFAHVEVKGEVSRLTRPSSGHLYFTIKDAHATISAVIWRSTAVRLKTALEDGGEYIFSGHLSLYEPRGTYQLIISRIEAAGDGKLAAEFEQRKRTFAEKGWFDPGKKIAPPPLPKHIGIVTSPTAAALEDVKKVLATRPAWLQLTLSPCLVQGSGAADSIAGAINRAVKMKPAPDLILLVRGGGSIEDLWCFNDELVVKAVVESPIPIISGIGHEIDTTLADFAADARAATPSNAAELCCPSREELLERLPRPSTLASLVRQQLSRLTHNLDALQRRELSAWQRSSDSRHHSSEQVRSRLLHTAGTHIYRLRSPLRTIEKRLAPLQPRVRLQKQRFDWSKGNIALKHSLRSILEKQKRHRLELLIGKLSELDPTSVLKRGYAIGFTANGKLITSASSLAKNDQIDIRFHDGVAEAEIKSIKRSKP